MIIRIEDAPHIKHIKIDINFDDDEPSVNITNSGNSGSEQTFSDKPKIKKSMMDDVKLDMDETFDVEEEIIAKPEIPDHDREVKVASDMESLEL